MKDFKTFYYIIFLISLISYSQNYTQDFIRKYENTPEHQKKEVLLNYLNTISKDKNFIKNEFYLSAYFEKTNQKNAAITTTLYMSSAFREYGDYANSIKYSLKALQISESMNDLNTQLFVLGIVATLYDESNNFKLGQRYYKQLIGKAKKYNKIKYYADGLNGLGSLYSKFHKTDSARHYAQLALYQATKLKDTLKIYTTLSTLGETYLSENKNIEARYILKKSLNLAMQKSDLYTAMYVNNDFAKSYLDTKEHDSVAFFAYKTLSYSKNVKYPIEKLRALHYLAEYYEKIHKCDSSNKYFRQATLLKDSIFGGEKSKEIQAITFQEQLRQQKLELEKEKEIEERKHMIQYAAIAIGILTIIIVILILTSTILVNEKLIEFLSIMTLLVFFEFINLIIHPYIATITHETPFIMLSIMVCIAALLIPLHHRIEKFAITRLIQKNKQLKSINRKKTRIE